MPAYHVQRSTTIQASPEKVFDTVVDYRTWTAWSPWLGVDRDAVVTVSENSNSVGSLYDWTGELVGEGEIEHESLDRPHAINDEIRFVKPFKSKSGVSFELTPDGDGINGHGTKITWHMDGKLPWFLFWMKSSIEVFIGMDYDRGLKMLKEFVETGQVLSNSEVVGVEDVEARNLIGHGNSSSIAGIGAAMNQSVQTATDKLAAVGISLDGDMLSAYHPTDLKLGRFNFVTGYSLPDGTAVPAGLEQCELPAGKALHIRHTGCYSNLGNAWSGAYQYARYKKLKIAKRDGYEVYRNSPKDTDPADLVTDIYVPLK